MFYLGETGKDFLDFLLKLSADDRKVTDNDPEPLTVTGDNVLQLLTNSGKATSNRVVAAP